MFNVLSYFRRADGLRRVSSAGKREREKKVRNVSKERNAVPTLSGFTGAASRGVGRSTAENYRTAVRSFVRFNSGRDVPLSALDAETLRTIYNKAAAKRLVKDSASFKGVLTGNERTVKRSIEAEEVHRLLLSPFPPPSLRGRNRAGGLIGFRGFGSRPLPHTDKANASTPILKPLRCPLITIIHEILSNQQKNVGNSGSSQKEPDKY